MNFLIPILLFSFFSSVADEPPVYNFKLKNLQNKTVSYNELKGEELTVIDFWATWCKPCINSIPKFVEMFDEFESEGVQFIGISVDGPRNLNKVNPFVKSLGVDYPILTDLDNEVMNRLGVRAIPSLLIVDNEDDIVFFHEGYAPGEEQLIRNEIIRQLNL